MPTDESQVSHYILEPYQMERLKHIMTRMYADKPLVGDDRRDLANTMFAVLGGVFPVYRDKP